MTTKVGPDGEFIVEDTSFRDLKKKRGQTALNRLNLRKLRNRTFATILSIVLISSAWYGIILPIHMDLTKGDRAVEAFKINFLASDKAELATLTLGEIGHPVNMELSPFIEEEDVTRHIDDLGPKNYWVETLSETPHLYPISGCTFFLLPQAATHLYAVTEYFATENITIDMPRKVNGAINLCTTDKFEVRVALWVDKQ